MQLEKYDRIKHYDTIVKWSEEQNWPAMPIDFYGDTGFVAYKKDKPVVAGFLFKLEGCPISLMEWVVGDPKADWHDRKDGIDLIIESCQEQAKEQGSQFILTMTKNKRLIEKYKDNQFMETDSEMTHLMRRV